MNPQCTGLCWNVLGSQHSVILQEQYTLGYKGSKRQLGWERRGNNTSSYQSTDTSSLSDLIWLVVSKVFSVWLFKCCFKSSSMGFWPEIRDYWLSGHLVGTIESLIYIHSVTIPKSSRVCNKEFYKVEIIQYVSDTHGQVTNQVSTA